MNRKLCAAIGLLLLLGACTSEDKQKSSTDVAETTTSPTATDTVPEVSDPRIEALLEAYPDFITAIKDNKVYLSDGTDIPYNDGKEKDFLQKLDNSDVEDMFSLEYTSNHGVPKYLADAGRSRCELLFRKMYGSSAAEVSENLVDVSWFGEKIKFTAVNGAAEKLKQVAQELENSPELKKYMKCSGTFYWRQVRGAQRLSAHSYGIAIDIAVDYSDYWHWKFPNASETDKVKYANKIPLKIVEAFERHGFIWGGAWYHYDTMHFEYRPEILIYAAKS